MSIEMTNEQIEEIIRAAVVERSDDICKILDEHEAAYDGDIYDFAFREAIAGEWVEYVEEHVDDFDLYEDNSYLDLTENELILDILMSHGCFRDWDYYSDMKFAIETGEWMILTFDPEFQKEVFGKYLKKHGLTEPDVIDLFENPDGEFEFEAEEDDADTVISELEALGVVVEDGKLSLRCMDDEENSDTMDVMQDLGYIFDFEGDEWKMCTSGVYFIK